MPADEELCWAGVASADGRGGGPALEAPPGVEVEPGVGPEEGFPEVGER